MKNPDLFRFFVEFEWSKAYKSNEVLIGKQLIKLEPGQAIFGRKEWSKRTGLSEKQIRTSVKFFTQTFPIWAIKSTNKFSIITELKCLVEDEEGQQEASKGPTKGQQGATSKKDKEDKKKDKEVKLKKPSRSSVFFREGKIIGVTEEHKKTWMKKHGWSLDQVDGILYEVECKLADDSSVKSLIRTINTYMMPKPDWKDRTPQTYIPPQRRKAVNGNTDKQHSQRPGSRAPSANQVSSEQVDELGRFFEAKTN